MACSKPVIASPVGINKEIVEPGINGFLCNNSDEWLESLMRLYSHEPLRISMGAAGREKVKNRYCLQVTSGRLAMLLKAAAKS
jgi:glycosyltransferase involved in cell wall biosynthesis